MNSDDTMPLDTFLDQVNTIQETAAETYCETTWSGNPDAIIACQEGVREWKTNIDEKIEFDSYWQDIMVEDEVNGLQALGLTSNNPMSPVYKYCVSSYLLTFPCTDGADHAADLAVSTFELEGIKQLERG